MPLFSAIKLLRIPISYYLLPIYLFAFSMADGYNLDNAILLFVCLHLFIYPASNAYNSYVDQDESSIVGLKNPPKADQTTFILSIIFDLIGLGIALYIHPYCALFIMGYMVATKAYSWRKIRLKKYPLLGFFTVIIVQGLYVFTMVFVFIQDLPFQEILVQKNFLLPAFCSSLIMAGVFPISQIFQHRTDKINGDNTFSRHLGKRGTFIFSGTALILAGFVLGVHFKTSNQSHLAMVFAIFIFPTIAYYLWWAAKVWEDPKETNYRNTMLFNNFCSTCLILYFVAVYLIKNRTDIPF